MKTIDFTHGTKETALRIISKSVIFKRNKEKHVSILRREINKAFKLTFEQQLFILNSVL